MNRHERAGNRMLPAVIALSDGTTLAVLPRSRGRHQAIIVTHAFVPYRDDESMGCGHVDEDDPARCGFYRRHHATMAVHT